MNRTERAKRDAEIVALREQNYSMQDIADMLQNRFMFKENDRGSYVNSGIRRIIYDRDYSIIPVQ